MKWCGTIDFSYFYIVLVFIILLCQSMFSDGSPTSNSVLEFRYHKYSNMTRYMKEFSEQNHDLAELYSIGQSVQERELWVMKMTATKKNAVNIPPIKLLANIHGNEAAGREILLHFINYLAMKYRSGDKKVRHLLDNNVVHIMPSLNPDGFERSMEGMCSRGLGRQNAKDMDLNRSFPDYFRNNRRPLPAETKAVSEWMNRYYFILSASLHGGAMVANYPFENTNEDLSFSEPRPSIAPDDDVFRHLALVYSKTHPIMHHGKPCTNDSKGFNDGITNGAAWYPLTGGMQDYNYVMHGCMEVTLEVSCCKYPMASELEAIWMQNRNALLEYCLQAGYGIKGIIRSIATSEAVASANLMIEGRNMSFFSSPHGEYFRILLPGNYKLKIQAAGYKDKTVFFTVDSPNPGEYPTMKQLNVYLRLLNDSTTEDREYNTWAETTSYANTQKVTEATTTISSLRNDEESKLTEKKIRHIALADDSSVQQKPLLLYMAQSYSNTIHISNMLITILYFLSRWLITY